MKLTSKDLLRFFFLKKEEELATLFLLPFLRQQLVQLVPDFVLHQSDQHQEL